MSLLFSRVSFQENVYTVKPDPMRLIIQTGVEDCLVFHSDIPVEMVFFARNVTGTICMTRC